MKKGIRVLLFILILSLVGLCSSAAFAVPAANVPFELSQPNGEKFKATVNGDEKYNWTTAETGEVIIQDSDKYWKFAQKVNGKLQPGKIKYSKTGQKPVTTIKDNDIIVQIKKQTIISNSPGLIDSKANENIQNQSSNSDSQTSDQYYSEILKNNNILMQFNSFQSKDQDSSQASGSSTSGSTSSGSLPGIAQAGSTASSEKIIVLLVQFSNINMKYSETQWSNTFFGTTGNTVSNYYREVSNGKFTFIPATESWGTANDGVIRVTLPYNHPNTGGNIGSANQQIVVNALKAADPYINYASFDINGDGTISPNELHILTVVAGYETAYGGGSYPSVWAHSWNMNVTLDGKYMYKYTQQGEIHSDHMATIGTACHELGHDLGLPDLYDYDYSSAGVGIHSLMAGGSWAYYNGYQGNSPTHMDAWNKIKLGYITPTIASSLGNYTVKSFDTGQYNVLKIPTSNPNQYYLVENRQFVGFDRGLSNTCRVNGGIAIWHIDDSVTSRFYRINDDETHKGVDLEESNEGIMGYSQLDENRSGFYIGSDFYVGYAHYYFSGNTSTIYKNTNKFGPSTVPNSSLYDGTRTNITISANAASSNSMTVTIGDGSAEVAPVISNVSIEKNPFNPKDGSVATISYTLSKDAYIKVIIYNKYNEVVRTIADNVLRLKGSNSASWDGNDDAGEFIGDQVCSYKIFAVDKTGLNADPYTGSITVETGKPVITSFGASPEPYSPCAEIEHVISFRLSEDALLNIDIYDSKGNYAMDLWHWNSPGGVKSQTWLFWHAYDNSGKPLRDDVYTYKMLATDSFGNKSDEVIGTFTIKHNSAIQLILYGDKPDPMKASSKITYGLTQPGYINLNIYDDKGNLVRSLLKKSPTDKIDIKKAGTHYINWTGRNNNGALVPSGIYTYKIEAFDYNGNISDLLTGTITVDRTGPTVSNLAVSVNPFIPNGANGTVISYDLSEDCKINLNVYNSKGTLVRTLLNKASQNKGTNSMTWNGKNKYDEFLPDGVYTIRVSGYDSLGNRSATASKTIIVDRTAPVIDNVSDSPDPLGVGNGQKNTIKYSLSENAHVSINIYDSKNNLVKTLINADVLSGNNQAEWDGKNNAGGFVPNDIYLYRINATDITGQSAVEAIGNITTDRTAIVIINVGISPDRFIPSGVITYAISKDAVVTVKILDSNNQEVARIENETAMTSGTHASVWDGKNSSGTDVTSGTYKYTITAVDSVGLSASAGGSIPLTAVDKTAPTITNVSDAPDPLKLGAAGAGNTIKYTMSEYAHVTLGIYSTNGVLMRPLVNANLASGENSVEWDGKDNFGNLVADGTYIYKINATDESGNAASEVYGLLTTDQTPIKITNVSVSPEKFAISGSINYTLSENGTITIVIYDEKNNVINTIANAATMDTGAQSTIWDGKDSNGLEAQSGTYIYIITAIDKVGFMATAKGIITVDGPVPVISNVSCDAPVFTPLGLNMATIGYTISSNANVTVKIYDSKNNAVKTLLDKSAVLRGQNSIAWNGKNDSGAIVADGTYTYKISGTDVSGKASNVAAATIIIDGTPPTITNVNASPNPFGTSSATTIFYTLSEPTKVSVKILDTSESVIRMLQDSVNENAGINTIAWDGKDNSGNSVTGDYTFVITAVDEANFTVAAKGSVTVIDDSNPLITNVSHSPEPFSPNGTNTLTTEYTLSKAANVTIRIYDTNGSVIKTLINNINQQKGLNSIWWDGKNDSGVIVPEGKYTYKINAVDSLGNPAVEAVDTVAVGAVLTITQNSMSCNPFIVTGSNTTKISYALSKAANVNVIIQDFTGNDIKTVYNGTSTVGVNTAVWDGKNSSNAVVGDGTYKYKIAASDMIGQTAVVTENFEVVSSTIGITNISDDPDPFKADGSMTRISYTLSKNGLVSVEILNSNSVSVKKLYTSAAIYKGDNTAYWDGTDSNGNIVSDGVYTYRITAVDSTTKESVSKEGTITIQKYPPAGDIKDLTFSPNPYTPNGGNTATISFTLTSSAIVTAVIIDSNNGMVKTLTQGENMNTGSHTITWDGVCDNNELLLDGVYIVKVSAVNGLGIGNTATTSFKVERQSPVISEISDGPKPFKANNVDLWSVSFILSEDANVYLGITDSTGSTVWSARPVIFTKGSRSIELYGTNDAGQLLSDGQYTYKLWALDFAGKKSNEVTGTIIIHKTRPVISKVSASPSVFSASTNVFYNLSEDAKVTVSILSGNTVVRTIESNSSKIAGDNSFIWDGKDEQGATVDDGTYTFTITAQDIVGLTDSEAGTVTKDCGKPVISNVSDSVDPFTPNGANNTAISYTLSKNAYVTLIIYDSNGVQVKTLLNKYPAGKGISTVTWDGKNDNGTMLTDGVYTYRINAVDTLGASAVQVGGTVTIDKTAPVISNFSANPDPFAPDGMNNATIGYTLSETSKVTISILDGSNNILRILQDNLLINAGSITVLWDGTADGAIVEDDIYRVKITAVDGAGNSTDCYGTIGIDRLYPSITAIDDEPDPFNPNIEDFSTIHAAFSEWMQNVNADIYDKDNNKLKSINPTLTNEFWWGWSGTNSAGTKVADGIYTYKVNGTDLFGKSIKEADGTVTIDTKVPEISNVSFTPELENPSGTISYTLSEPAKVTIIIYNASNYVIAQIESNSQKSTGANTAFWDGTQNDGKLVGYGVYTYKITAIGSNGASALPASGIITFETVDPDYVDEIIEDNAGEETSTPSSTPSSGTAVTNLAPVLSDNSVQYYKILDGRNDYCGIKFKLSKTAKVTINIYGSSSNLIKTLVNGVEYKSGYSVIAWNGTNNYGNTVAQGEYTYRINAVDSNYKPAQEISGVIAVDTVAPRITDVKFTPNTDTPSGTFIYSLSETSQVTLTVYNGSNTVVRIINSDGLVFAGDNSISWDGRNSAGKLIGYGTYQYRIDAKDMSGNTAQPAVGIIVLDIATSVIDNTTSSTDNTTSSSTTSQFTIKNVGSSPSIFEPSGNIYYTITQNANVTVIVYDSSNSIVKTLESSTTKAAGRNSAFWDGTNYKGEEVNDGEYSFRISAYNNNGQSATPMTGAILVEKSAPAITNAIVSPNPLLITNNESSAVLSYTMSEKAYVTAKIYDSKNTFVRTLVDSNQQKGFRQAVWDGRNFEGVVVASGTYTCKINAVDLYNKSAKEVTINISVDSSQLSKVTISNLTASPDPYSVKGIGGGNNPLTISYQISDYAAVTVAIYSGNALIKTIYAGVPKTAGSNTATWYGVNEIGNIVSAGAYKYKVTAVSERGAVSTAEGTISVK